MRSKGARMPSGRSLLALLALSIAGASVAAAEAPPAKRHRFGGDTGIASALGSVGVDYQFAPLPWLRLEGAIGYGVTGVQLSVMPKLAFGGGRCAFTVGFGPSLAIGGQQAKEGPEHAPHPGVIPWLNLDVPGIECRWRAGLSFQATLGLTTPLVAFHWDFVDVGGTVQARQLFGQGRIGFGWWF
jgi:hypothetical protein